MAPTPINRSPSHSPVPATPPGTTSQGGTPRPSVGDAASRHSRQSGGELSTLSRAPSRSSVAGVPGASSNRPPRASLPGSQREPSIHAEAADDGTVAEIMETHDTEATRRQARSSAPTIGEAATVLAGEFFGKALASSIHFGATSNFTQAGVSHLLGKMLLEEHPVAGAAVTATATALPLAFMHAFAEVVVRTAVLQQGGQKLREWNAAEMFPGDEAAQKSFKTLQGASKIGSTVGNAIGLASFCIVQGSRSAMGFSSPASATAGSALAGGTMALFHTLLAMTTGQKTEQGQFEHTHGTKEVSPKDTLDEIKKAIQGVVTKGGTGNEIWEGVHEIAVGRAPGAFLGLLSSLIYKAREEAAHGTSQEPSEAFQQTATATFMLLGLFFFSNLGLAGRRTLPKNSALFESTKKTFAEAFNVEKAVNTGSMTEITKKLGDGPVAKSAQQVAKGADIANKTVSELSKLPAHVALDTIEAMKRQIVSTGTAESSAAAPTGDGRDDLEMGARQSPRPT